MISQLCFSRYYFAWISICSLFLPPASEGWGKVLFSVCLSVHISGGGTHPRSGRGGEVPNPRSRWGEGVPHPRSRWGRGYPIPGQDRVPPGPGMGYPPDLGQGTHLELGWGTPKTWDRVTPPDLGHSKHLLHSGWYASCVHAGGLSCFVLISKQTILFYPWVIVFITVRITEAFGLP